MRQPVGLLQFPLLLEGIFHPHHCDLQTLHSYESSRLVLACCSCSSIANGAQMTSNVARSIPLVPHQALFECTHWLCWAWDHSLIVKMHPLLYYGSLLCILFQGHFPPRVTVNGILSQRWGLGHLLWDFWCLALTASLWTPLVFLLWPRAQFLCHCISVVSWIVSCWRTYWPIILSYHGSQLHWGGICVDLKGLWKVQVG